MWRNRRKLLENIKIEKIWFGGVWIVKMEDGKTLLISGGVLPGMIVDVRILKNKKDYIAWQVYAVKNFDLNVKDNKKLCKHNFIFGTDYLKDKVDLPQTEIGCGWCKWQVLPYDEQIKLKEQVVKDSFFKTWFFDEVYTWIVPSKKVFNYRNKMEFSFWRYISKKTHENGQVEYDHLSDWSLGFHKQWQFSKIIDIDDCLIAWDKINKIFKYLKLIFQKSWLPVYDQMRHTWFFRHFVVREGSNTGQFLVNLNVATKHFENNKKDLEIWNNLQKLLKEDNFLEENITSFMITENNGLADVVNGQDIKTYDLWWDGSIFEKLIIDDVETTFKVSAFSFFQTNTHQAQMLFKTAKDMLPKIKWNILDLYCGAGTIGITLLKQWIWEKLLWVEIVPDAVEDAKQNAKLNWIAQESKFIADKAENINFEAENIGLVVIDPPRSWLHKNVVNFLINLKTKYKFPLLYISCNPVTMARDLKMLEEWWWNIQNLKAVDMFPHTHHIEMVWLLK